VYNIRSHEDFDQESPHTSSPSSTNVSWDLHSEPGNKIQKVVPSHYAVAKGSN